MRMLGILFLLALAIATVGYFRGWFAVYTNQAAGGGIRVSIHEQRVRDDSRASAVQLRRMLPAATPTATPTDVLTEERTGTVTSFEPNEGHLIVLTQNGTLDLIVPSAIPILRNTEPAGSAALQANQRVLLTFDRHVGERQLVRIELLP